MPAGAVIEAFRGGSSRASACAQTTRPRARCSGNSRPQRSVSAAARSRTRSVAEPTRSCAAEVEWWNAPVAQLDRATGFEPVGRGFDSLRARHFLRPILNTVARSALLPRVVDLYAPPSNDGITGASGSARPPRSPRMRAASWSRLTRQHEHRAARRDPAGRRAEDIRATARSICRGRGTRSSSRPRGWRCSG